MAFSEQHLKRDTKALADSVLEVQRLAQTVKGEAGKTGSSEATRNLPQLPIEVWENVIDHLWNDQWTLRRCRLVCRAWYSPSRFHLDQWVDINNGVQGVKAYARMLKQTPELSKRAREMSILGSMYAGENRLVDLSALSMAAILLARKLPRLDLLKIRNTEWKPWTMHIDIFLHLSAFSVTRLDLHGVTFPSITVFGRLVCALRGLVELECCDLEFIHDYFDHDTFDLYHNRVSIRFLTLGDALMGSEKLMDFLAHPCISSRLQRLNIDDSPLAAELQHQWKYKQLLDAVSGSLPELQLVLPYSGQQTHAEVSAAGVHSKFM
ncbi:uncharacterized protein LAESUDRAFT_78696 [Laetiporus sulphureus 93-53]|uniref:F-box domain-containing protein n=1 Tax=Laetiporus sulphureus 93-53 TaxID=1314785 RepID=A0A165F1B3_9APHY|nr:uncharacterized protein LAESUDRAFT_78696 [Laetiporus sulphureus 93-53]KZT08160.1 hypothetical protein LAESUDRAFT_78696 [Laetiporus sulphureus 93-53]